MSTQQVVQFQYTQAITWDGARWSERVEAQVALSSAALSTGWLKENFTGHKGGALDFIVLTAIIMHARPLRGDDLDLFMRLRIASQDDEGRLYARVSDVGLADELGVHRKTIAASAQRLARAGFISVLELPDNFRDSRGRFSGSKAYLVSGDMERYLPKIVAVESSPDGRDHRGSLSATDAEHLSHRGSSSTTADGHRGSLSATDTPENAPTVAVEVPHRGSLTATNIKMINDSEEEEGFLGKIAAERVFAAFAVLLGREYAPTEKDRKHLALLAKDGYSTNDITAAMERVKNNLGGDLTGVQSFAYVVPEIRRYPPAGIEHPKPQPTPVSDEAVPDNEPSSTEADALEIPAPEIPTDVARAFSAVMRRSPTPVERQRLVWLHDALTDSGTDADAGWMKILDAIKFGLNPDARQPVAYLRRLLKQPTSPSEGQGTRDKNAPDQATGNRRPAKPASTALTRQQEDEHPPIVMGGIVLRRPPERPSGYVVPYEATQRQIYDSVMALRELGKRLGLQHESKEHEGYGES